MKKMDPATRIALIKIAFLANQIGWWQITSKLRKANRILVESNLQLIEFGRLMTDVVERDRPELMLDPEIQKFLTNWQFDQIVGQNLS